MSTVGGIGSTSNPTSSTDAFSALTSGEFLQIIFTELTNQDPLEPNGTQDMINQLSSLRSIESDSQMVESLQNMVRQSEFAAASQLIGSLVSGITLDNRRVADLVVSVSMTQDGPVLNMFDGSRMFFNNVDEIVGPIDDPSDPSDPNDPNDPADPPDDTPSDSTPGIHPEPDSTGTVNPGDTQSDVRQDNPIDPIRQVVSIDV